MSSAIFCLIVALTSTLTALADQEVSSPLRVAQCRATCLQKFSNDSPSGESMCLQGPDCFMCWENCELLQSNFQVWGSMCQEKEICFPGCQQACAFHASAARSAHQTQPVIHTKGEGVIRVSGPLARWPAPGDEPAPADPIVYVVMRRSATGPWRQIIQTVSLATRVPPTTEGALLRVLVVDPRGLVTIYSPDESWTRFEASLKKKKTSGDDPLATTPESYLSELRNHVWSLKEVSLIHQKVLVIGEIAWEPRIMKGVYLVTWEVDGGGLKGNLFTDSTSVTLSLWPDTIYHIQVELVSRMPGIENEKSEMMTLDTSRAQRVSTESAEDAAGERAARDESADELYSVLVSSMRGRRAGARPAAREPLLGACAAIALFALVAAALAWRRRRHGTFPGTNVYIGDSSVRSRKLVEDFLPVKGFHPILTMVSDAPAASPLRAAPAPDVQV